MRCPSGEKAEARPHGGLPPPQNFGLAPPPPPKSRGVALGPSIILRSAAASIDLLRLRPTSWAAAERRAACKVRGPRGEGRGAAAGWPGERAWAKLAQRDAARAVAGAPGSPRVGPDSAPSHQA